VFPSAAADRVPGREPWLFRACQGSFIHAAY
jgi:hypothetical protein